MIVEEAEEIEAAALVDKAEQEETVLDAELVADLWIDDDLGIDTASASPQTPAATAAGAPPEK